MCNSSPASTNSGAHSERVVQVQPGVQVLIRRASLKDTSRLPNTNNLHFKDSHLSKLHASIKLSDGKFHLMDCGSTFGTVLNNYFLLPGLWNEIESGDIVGFIVSRPSASITKIVDNCQDHAMKIPLSEFNNPPIGLQFKIIINDNIIKFVPVKITPKQPNEDLPEFRDLYPSSFRKTTANESDSDVALTKLADTSLPNDESSPVVSKSDQALTPTIISPETDTPSTNPISADIAAPLESVVIDLSPSDSDDFDSQIDQDQTLSEGDDSDASSVECLDHIHIPVADDQNENEDTSDDEEYVVDETKVLCTDDKLEFDSEANSASSDTSSESSAEENEDSITCDIEFPRGETSNMCCEYIAPTDLWAINRTCRYNPKKRVLETYDVDEEEDIAQEQQSKRTRYDTNDQPQQKKFRTFAKEVGKGLVYVLATITALGIYGSSIDKQQ